MIQMKSVLDLIEMGVGEKIANMFLRYPQGLKKNKINLLVWDLNWYYFLAISNLLLFIS